MTNGIRLLSPFLAATVAATGPAAARATQEPVEGELPDAIRVSGRVVFPAGTPSDEELSIVARGERFAGTHEREVRVAPATDGAFEVAFAKGTRRGKVSIRARFLYPSS